MARISVEDCLEEIQSRFALVTVAAKRSKQLLKGSQPLIDNKDNNKEIVVSLREIAEGKVRLNTPPGKSDDS